MNDTSISALSATQRRDWLRLIRSENVGTVTFFRLLERFGSARAALDALPDLARQGGRRSYKIYPESKVDDELAHLDRIGARLIAWCEPDYPEALRAVEGGPPLFSALGNTHLLARPSVAIVGARNASANGLSFARKLSAELGRGGFGCNNLVVTSGLARGLDAAAHHGALETGTIAVLGGGVDVVYPKENDRLYDEVVERGLVIAEMAVGTKPAARLFPIRNRLISGLSRGVVVVEASPRSGSLITARLALEQGREVFAVPGAPGDPRTRGTNGLIREGATLTESAADVLRVLGEAGTLSSGPQFNFDFGALNASKDNPDELDLARSQIKELLGNSPVAVDELVRNCQFSIAAVSAVLLELELAGRLERQPGNRVCLIIDHDEMSV
ncbi:MAG: DNA-protecting protein DprA [Rhodospirillales bacterium]|jgi:DNA processing protein|nr:DNA-protecting protein DprA [Rhodospirillales bacterium]MBT4628384.1 DNA-protecting protein DprA [Rhodospirillales bacterium]MBT5350965.1 DNA-protecting protein DprA [Rhodospirillales bacterium]MBT5522120.1 DNA-protecting protein DprA [Rhodospirillales bacterium]MBT6110096.1 DNA-protecting protein DprA [Rhodospirillales bacterium]